MYSKNFHTATKSSPIIPFNNGREKIYPTCNIYDFSESIIEKLSNELQNVKTQLDCEIAKRKQAELTLEKQQNFSIITVHLLFGLSSEWTTLANKETPLEKQSIFPTNSKLNPVFQFIEDNYYQQINLSDVAKAVGYSRAYLTNLTKRLTKRTIHSWIVERRMTEARSLLLETDQPVNQIAARVGYPDSGHFSRQFRQIHKMPPKAWRDMHRVLTSEISA